MAVTNLFVIFTSAHLFHAQNIIDSKGLKNNHFIFTKQALADEYSKNGNTTVIPKLYPLNLVELIRLKRALGRSNDLHRLIVPHFLNVTAQAIYHFLVQKNKLHDTAIMPDGNLLFNNFAIKPKDPANWLRKIKSALLFSKFTLIAGDICSISDKKTIVYSYLLNTRYAENDKYTVARIKMSQQKTPEVKGLLILGHYNQKTINASDLYQSIQNLVSQFDTVIYKPHPRLNSKKDIFLKKLRKEVSWLTIHDASESAEHIVGKTLDINTVFAVGSSSLINLKLLQPTLEIYCCGMEEYFQEHYDKRLQENMQALNIKMLPFLSGNCG